MSLEEGSGGPPPGGFGGEEAVEEAAEEATEASEGGLWGLRNTEPAVAPQEVGRQLDLEADWWQHMAAGFIKQSSAEGTEAWMHYAMGGVLLALEALDMDVEQIGSSEETGGQDPPQEGEWSGDWSERGE